MGMIDFIANIDAISNTPMRAIRARKVTGIHKKRIINSAFIPHRNNDFRDYMSAFQLYLPYVASISLDASQIVGNSLTIDCYLDVRSGSLKYTVLLNGQTIIATASGSIRVDLPVTRIDKDTTTGAQLMQGATNLLTTTGAGAVMGGGVGAVVGGVVGAVNMGVSAYTQLKKPNPVSVSGGSGGSVQLDDPLGVYLIEYIPDIVIEPGIVGAYGRPSNKWATIGSNSGYVEVTDCRLNSTASESEKAEIIALLQSGVIV